MSNIKIGSKQQLFDLNGETTNFDLNFSVKSKDNVDFYAVVIDQTTLDNNPELQFKKSNNGMIGGNIVYDKNVYQNYFLCLKSDQEEHLVDMVIEKKEIQTWIHALSLNKQTIIRLVSIIKKSISINWQIIFIVILVCGALIYLWYSRNKKTVSHEIGKDSGVPFSENIVGSQFNSPGSMYSSSSDSSVIIDTDIMSKLKNMEVK